MLGGRRVAAQVTAAIVTCGGLCPGLNDVVAGLVNKLTVRTAVDAVLRQCVDERGGGVWRVVGRPLC